MNKTSFTYEKLSIDLWRLPDVTVIAAHETLISKHEFFSFEHRFLIFYPDSEEFKVHKGMATATIAEGAAGIIRICLMAMIGDLCFYRWRTFIKCIITWEQKHAHEIKSKYECQVLHEHKAKDYFKNEIRNTI